jgi:S-adenosylmethionine hydrolase
MTRPVITLTTDFGQADSYVGAMKGVILGICPEAALVDISHQIRPQAIQQAAYVLASATPYFPDGAVHLVVVDPGVGSERHPIAVQTSRAIYVAPDNGVLNIALEQDPGRLAVRLTESRYRLPDVSATFHGRDIFAPAAAHLACGTPLHELGEELRLADLITLPNLKPRPEGSTTWLGQVLHTDHFGNLITNFQCTSDQAFDDQLSILLAGERIVGLKRTFADVEQEHLVAYVGSSGRLEIAVREGNAAALLGVDVGEPVRVEGWS